VGSSNVIGMSNTTTSGSTGIYGKVPGQVTQDYVSFSTVSGSPTYLAYISTGWIPPVDNYYDTLSMNYVQFFTNPTDFTLSFTSATPSFGQQYQTVGSNKNSITPIVGNYYAAAIVTSNIIGVGASTFTNTTRFGTVPASNNNNITLYWNIGYFTYILSQWGATTDHVYDTASGYYVSFFSNLTSFTLSKQSLPIYNKFDSYTITNTAVLQQNTIQPTIGYWYAGSINSYNAIGVGVSSFSGPAVRYGDSPPPVTTYSVSWDPSNPTAYVMAYFILPTDFTYNRPSSYRIQFYGNATQVTLTSATTNGATTFGAVSNTTSANLNMFFMGGIPYYAQYSGLPTLGNWYGAGINSSNLIGMSSSNYTTMVRYGKVPGIATSNYVSFSTGTASYLPYISTGWLPPVDHNYDTVSQNYVQFFTNATDFTLSFTSATPSFDVQYAVSGSNRNSITPTIGNYYAAAIVTSNIIGRGISSFTNTTRFGTAPGAAINNYVSFSTGTTSYFSYISTGWLAPVNNIYDTVSQNYVQFFSNATDFTLSFASATPSFDVQYAVTGLNKISITPTIGNYYAAAIVTSNIIGRGISSFTNTTRYGIVPGTSVITALWNTTRGTSIYSSWTAPTNAGYNTLAGYYVSFFSNSTTFAVSGGTCSPFDVYKNTTNTNYSSIQPTLGYYYAATLNGYNVIGCNASSFSATVRYGVVPGTTSITVAWDSTNYPTSIYSSWTAPTNNLYNTVSGYYVSFFSNSTTFAVSGGTCSPFYLYQNTTNTNYSSIQPTLGYYYAATLNAYNVIGCNTSSFSATVRYGTVPGAARSNYVSFSTGTASYLGYISTGWLAPVDNTYDTVSQNYVQFFTNATDFTLSPTSAISLFDQQYATTSLNQNSIAPTVGNYYAAAIVTSNIIGRGISSFTNTTRFGTAPGATRSNYVSFSTGTATYLAYISTGWLAPVNNSYDTVSQNYVQFFSNANNFTLSFTSATPSFDVQYAVAGLNKISITPTIGNYYAAAIVTSNAIARGISSFTNTTRYGTPPAILTSKTIGFVNSTAIVVTNANSPTDSIYNTFTTMYLQLFSNAATFTLSPTAGIAAFDSPQSFTASFTVNSVAQATIGNYYAAAIVASNVIGTTSSFTTTARFGAVPPASSAITVSAIEWLGNTTYLTVYFTAPTIGTSLYNRVTTYNILVSSNSINSTSGQQTFVNLIVPIGSVGTGYIPLKGGINGYSYYNITSPTIGNWYGEQIQSGNPVGYTTASVGTSMVQYGSAPATFTATAPVLRVQNPDITVNWTGPIDSIYNTVASYDIKFYRGSTQLGTTQSATASATSKTLTLVSSDILIGYYSAVIYANNAIGIRSATSPTTSYGSAPASFTVNAPTVTTQNISVTWVTPTDSGTNTVASYIITIYYNAANTAGVAGTMFSFPQSATSDKTNITFGLPLLILSMPSGYYYSAVIDAKNIIGTTTITSGTTFFINPIITISSVSFNGTTVSVSFTCSETLATGDYYEYSASTSSTASYTNNSQTVSFTFNPTVGSEYFIKIRATVSSSTGPVKQANFIWTNTTAIQYTVPSTAISANATVIGAGGGSGVSSSGFIYSAGGAGSMVSGPLTVGSLYQFSGGSAGTGSSGGSHGGGGAANYDHGTYPSGGGGGYSLLQLITGGGTVATIIYLAAGGGGAGGVAGGALNNFAYGGGKGGGTTGGNTTGTTRVSAAKGGSQTAGGAGGLDLSYSMGANGGNGGAYQGGTGGNIGYSTAVGGGGGGGYYGGGGGAAINFSSRTTTAHVATGGGGGSDYIDSGSSGVSVQGGGAPGAAAGAGAGTNGYVYIVAYL